MEYLGRDEFRLADGRVVRTNELEAIYAEQKAKWRFVFHRAQPAI